MVFIFYTPGESIIIHGSMIAPIARPLGLHYNHYVSQSVRPSICLLPTSENVHKSSTTWYILSHFTYILVSTHPNHWHANLPDFDRYGFAVQVSSLLWSVSENPHNSWTLWDFLIKFCILIYFNIVQPPTLVCKITDHKFIFRGKMVKRVCWASVWSVKVF